MCPAPDVLVCSSPSMSTCCCELQPNLTWLWLFQPHATLSSLSLAVPVVCQNIAGAGSINVLFAVSYNSSKVGLFCDNYLYCYISQPYVEAVLFWDFQYYAGWGVIHTFVETRIYIVWPNVPILKLQIHFEIPNNFQHLGSSMTLFTVYFNLCFLRQPGHQSISGMVQSQHCLSWSWQSHSVS